MHWAIATGQLVSLSEQQLVDCSSSFKDAKVGGICHGKVGCNDRLLTDRGLCRWYAVAAAAVSQVLGRAFLAPMWSWHFD